MTEPTRRKPRALGIDEHKPGEFVYCSICRLDRASRWRAAEVHRQMRSQRRIAQLVEALR